MNRLKNNVSLNCCQVERSRDLIKTYILQPLDCARGDI